LVVGGRYTFGYIRVVHTHTYICTSIDHKICLAWTARPTHHSIHGCVVCYHLVRGRWGPLWEKWQKGWYLGVNKPHVLTTPCPNLCFLGIPQTSFSIKFKRELCHIYPDCTQQIDSMLKTQTNKQTDVYGRTEWQSPTSLDFVLCVVIWMGCWVVNLFSTINREHSICTL